MCDTLESKPTKEKYDKKNEIEILPFKNNCYRHTFYVNSIFYKYIIGPKGAVINKLRGETETQIQVPSPGSNNTHLTIIGSNKRVIRSARDRIDQLIEDSKKQLKYTYFISIPTNTDEIREKFNEFKEEILKNCENNAPGLKEGMFIEVGTLHLTLSMVLIIEDADRQKAINALHTCKRDIISSIMDKSGPISLELKGVKCMEKNTAKAKVLYVEVHEETGYLQEISNKIFNYILKQGLTRIERNKSNEVNLHMTIVKTQNLKTEKQKFIKDTFDATNILKVHENTFFGKINLSTFHLSQIDTRTEDGYYEALTTIDLRNF